jgi:hypothetical protein
MAKRKRIPQKSAEKYMDNIATNNMESDAIKGSSPKAEDPVGTTRRPHQKTESERVAFLKNFAGIVEENAAVKDNYLISFADVDYATQFYITGKDKKDIDLSKLLTQTEYSAYANLVGKWKK